MHNDPVIFIFDLDNTLIGNSQSLLDYQALIMFIDNACKSGKIPKNICQKYKSNTNIKHLLTDSFYRPGIKDGLYKLKQLYPTAELFIYSAGTEKYVKEFVAYFEEYTGVHFNRPLFTRNECIVKEDNNRGKSIIQQWPKIINTLKYKYKNVKWNNILENRLIFIDDSNVIWDKPEKRIICPQYSYQIIFDSMKNIPYKIKNLQIVKDYQTTANIGFVLPNDISIDEQYMQYHVYMADYYRSWIEYNKTQLQDSFIINFINAIKPYKNLKKPFSNANVAKINKAITV